MRQFGRTWDIQAVGNLDGDGFGDLVWRCTVPDAPDSGVSNKWFTDGAGVTEIKRRVGALLNWKLFDALELEDDDADDLLCVGSYNQVQVMMVTDSRSCVSFSAGSIPAEFTALKFTEFLGTALGEVLRCNAVAVEEKPHSPDAKNLALLAPALAPDIPNASCTPSAAIIASNQATFRPLNPNGRFMLR